ncbi:MAG: hypothetical protein F6K48_03190 [Okeania sp. SIO3H1]|nr:hypothetical protein [Okeania sp. SIO3H1]
MARKNPAAVKGTRKAASIPKGKKKGDVFTSGGKRFRVVSYTTKDGKRVRYAQAVTQCGSPAKKASCKTKLTAKKKAAKKNPYIGGEASLCRKPTHHKKRKPGHKYVDSRGVMCVVQRVGGKGKPGKKRTMAGFAHTGIEKPSLIGRKVGDKFQFNYQKWEVVRRKTAKGGYKKVAKKVS